MVQLDQLADAFADRGIEGARPWPVPETVTGPFAEGVYYLGPGAPSFEVCIVPAASRPKRDEVRELWKVRQANRATPLLVICSFDVNGTVEAQLCGPTEADLAVRELSLDQAVGLAAGGLAEPNGLAAARYLQAHTPRDGDDFLGLVNQGMFAAHTLRGRVREMPEWGSACESGAKLRTALGRDLVRALGFEIEEANSPVTVLRAANEQARAVAVFLDREESYESQGGRFGDSSALSLAFTRAARDNIPFVVLTRGSEIRLYAVGRHAGVGRKGQAETFVQADASLLDDDETGFLPLIFSAEALLPGGTFERILDWSRNYSAALSERLRDRVYHDVVPGLAIAVAAEHGGAAQDLLDEIYEETLVILFRLLFLAYAEDRGLLPYASNATYRRSSLKQIARELGDHANEGKTWEGAETHALWSHIGDLWEAIDKGNAAWDVPAYNGGLFSIDPDVNAAGAQIANLRLSDAQFGPALRGLLLEPDAEGTLGPIDFRSLSVRDFGTIYEGLLESSLSVATSHLGLDNRGNYVPASDARPALVEQGQIYFHNRSGARKSSGSYFTKDFAVEHLLLRALEPALDTHVQRLAGLLEQEHEDDAAAAFFDFRCADIAMGSGHFLVAAVDHIEKRLAEFLDEHPIALVEAELDRLRAAATKHLGDSAVSYEIERRQLLRRQVARRCVYGVDRNLLAVELARLSLWIHTFVPGLPLSFLDHNLVHGDSLTGVGTIDEAVDYLSAADARQKAKHGQGSVFEALIYGWLEEAREPLARLGRASDATRAELSEVRAAAREASKRIEPVRQLFDLLSAMRRGEVELFQAGIGGDAIETHPQLEEARDASAKLGSLHFPVAFPEVFLRDRPGFDCLLGNPPWEKLQVEEHSFYSLHYPGLRGVSQREAEASLVSLRKERPDLVAAYEAETELVQRMKTALAKGPYLDLTAGRPDLFKAFAWRFWQLLRKDGHLGIVLPRKALEASGMASWRRTILTDGVFDDVTMLVNKGGWVFDDVHQQYTIGLIAARLGGDADEERYAALHGPYSDLGSYLEGVEKPPEMLRAEDLLSWSESATFPLVRDAASMRVFLQIRSHPRLDEPAPHWDVRGLRELNATDDKHHFVFTQAKGLWPVYKGESFDLWQPDTGVVYAWADPEHIKEVLQTRRANQVRIKRSAFYGMSEEWAADAATLPAQHPRIAWRDTARATDTRTVRTALIPPNTVLVHQAYYLFFRQGGPASEAFALGVISSLPFDWYARQFVESHVTVEFMRSAPIPQPPADDPRRLRVVEIGGTLAAVDDRYEAWAAEVGVPVGGPSNDAERDALLAELDALVASLYGLDAEDLQQIFESFHAGWDYQERMNATSTALEAI